MAAASDTPTVVALLAMPEVTAATLYGFYDALSSAGRDWQMLHGQQPGTPLFRPLVVSHDGQPVLGANGVRIQADTSFAECPPPDVVCVTDLAVMPGQPLDRTLRPGRGLAARTPCRRCRARLRLLGRGAARAHRVAGRPRRHLALGLLRDAAARASAHPLACRARAGRGRRRPAPRDGRQRRRLARAGALSDRPLRRARRRRCRWPASTSWSSTRRARWPTRR